MSEDDQDIVTLKIAGIEYQLYCPPEEQSTLIEAGEILDKRIKSIKRKTRNLPIEKVAVLAGLDVVMNSSQTKELHQPRQMMNHRQLQMKNQPQMFLKKKSIHLKKKI